MEKHPYLQERHLLEELRNIVENGPLFAGDTVSHEGSYECVRRGWAFRDPDDNLVATDLGMSVYRSTRSDP